MLFGSDNWAFIGILGLKSVHESIDFHSIFIAIDFGAGRNRKSHQDSGDSSMDTREQKGEPDTSYTNDSVKKHVANAHPVRDYQDTDQHETNTQVGHG